MSEKSFSREAIVKEIIETLKEHGPVNWTFGDALTNNTENYTFFILHGEEDFIVTVETA